MDHQPTKTARALSPEQQQRERERDRDTECKARTCGDAMSNVVKDCVADSQEYLNHIVATCGARLVERIAEDYGLSQRDLLERYGLPSLSNGTGPALVTPSKARAVRPQAGEDERVGRRSFSAVSPLVKDGSPGTSPPKRSLSLNTEIDKERAGKNARGTGATPSNKHTYLTLDKVLEGTDSLLEDMQVLDVASDDLLLTSLKDDAGVERNVGETLKKVLMETDTKIVEMAKHIKYLANTLHSVFPPKVVEALKSELTDIAELHPTVSVLMSDIVGFTAWCADAPPTVVIECLSAYFQVVDDLAEQIGVYKVETIGDGYQAICGHNGEEDHAEKMATLGLAIINTIPEMRRIFKQEDFNVRVGVNSGPIVTGVIRADRPRWQLFGDTVNYASRMESTGEPGRVQVSRSTYDLLNMTSKKFDLERRGLIKIKGKGERETFWLTKNKDVASGSKQEGYKPLHEQDQNQDGKPTALIVDDMLSIILQLSRTLKKAGVHVVTARNGKEALEILKDRTFDVVLSDIHMPVMGGLDMVSAYREWEKEHRPNHRQKVYALTGTVKEDESMDTFIKAGFDSKMSKGIPKNELLSLVSHHL